MPISIGSRPDHGFDQPLGLLSDCHRRIERFLRILASIIEQADGRSLNEQELRAAETALEYFRTAAPRHTADEEQSLFPLLQESDSPAAQAAMQIVQALEHEHTVANAAHEQVDSLYRQWIDLGTLAPPQARELARVLQVLHELYRRHIDIEDQAIFPLAAQVLSQEQLTQLGNQMAQRRGLAPVGR